MSQSNTTDVTAYMQAVGKQARAASRILAAANTGDKNSALMAIYDVLKNAKPAILAANKIASNRLFHLNYFTINKGFVQPINNILILSYIDVAFLCPNMLKCYVLF